ncbi:hypothetical protein AVEN_67842-1 [Araneus ventricosus]|uniref:Uncharacterized protein n=1 Tax=Araneus ventricosus TaxID=182803 RepID=A0A4Y2WPC1_ARAVE|nr:hypothetical protein AVEN_67842-1 [Araneus ventricosus]
MKEICLDIKIAYRNKYNRSKYNRSKYNRNKYNRNKYNRNKYNRNKYNRNKHNRSKREKMKSTAVCNLCTKIEDAFQILSEFVQGKSVRPSASMQTGQLRNATSKID